MSSSTPRIVKLQRGRARGRGRPSSSRNLPSTPTNQSPPLSPTTSSDPVYRTNTLRRGRGRGYGRGRGRGRPHLTLKQNSNSNSPKPAPTIRGRGRGRGRGKSVIKTIPLPHIHTTTKKKKRISKNQKIESKNSYFQGGTEIKEWHKTPTKLLREWCQQHKRKQPNLMQAMITTEELEAFSKRIHIQITNAKSKAFRCRIVLPDKGNDRDKNLTFCTKEIYKTKRHSEHMCSLLALHYLCPSLPLQRKLPEMYGNIWEAFSSERHRVHAKSKFKSKFEQLNHENNKVIRNKIRDRKREQYEYERYSGLNRIHMNEDLRLDIQNILRKQYMEISKNDNNIGLIDMGMVDVKEIDSKLKDINAQCRDKIKKFLNKMVEELVVLGFKKEDCIQAAYSTAGNDFIKCEEKIDEYVTRKDNETLSDGTKVVKEYNINDYNINVNKYVGDGVTWLCLHLNEDELPSKYAAKGKQFEISVVNTNALGFGKGMDNDIDDIDKGIYYWLLQFGYTKHVIIKYMKREDLKDKNKYIILGEMYRKLCFGIGSNELKKALDLEVTDEMVNDSNDAIKNELDALTHICEGITGKVLKINGDKKEKNYIWSKRFKYNKCIGILEVYRIVNCKGFICYPLQIPIITFRSPNNTITYEMCQYIIQCLVKETCHILGEEMLFTLIQWIDDNIKKILHMKRTEIMLKLWGEKKEVIKKKKEDKEDEKEEKKDYEMYKLFSIQKEKPLKQNIERDSHLFKKYEIREKENKKYQQYLRLRCALPAYSYKDEIIKLMLNNQVVVISGETGCGKSTQIPQYILDHYIKNNCGSLVNIIVTQPRRISAIGLAERVSTERCESVGNLVGYSIRLENKCSSATQLLYCTTGILLRRLMTSLKIQSVTHVIIDEVHERSIDIDFLLVILKFLIEKRKDLKLILMSATLNSKLFSKYFFDCPILEIPGRTFPVKEFFLEDLLSESRISLNTNCKWNRLISEDSKTRYKQLTEFYDEKKLAYSDRILHQISKWDERDNHKCEIQLIIECIFHIIKTYPLNKNDSNGILVFLPGMYEINKTYEIFHQQLELKQMDAKDFWVIPLHSSLPTINQKKIFTAAPNGIRKIVLSTNIAETSITINDIKYVIDTGKMRQMSYNPCSEISELKEVWISKAHSMQRQGRAGRVGIGYCYKLYTKYKYLNKFIAAPIPELLRSNLENVSLKIKLLRQLSLNKGHKNIKKSDINGIKNILLSCIEPPDLLLIKSSIQSLNDLGALNDKELLTPLGYHLSKLPISNVRLGKMLIYSSIFKCLTPCIIIAAILTSGKSIYYTNRNTNDILSKIKQKYYNLSLKSDHITMYKFYIEWKKNLLFYTEISAKKFAYNNCLSHVTLQQIDGITKQYKLALKEIGFIDDTYRFEHAVIHMDNKFDVNSKSYKLIKSILVAGLYPNVIQIKLPKKKYDKTLTGQSERDIKDAKSIKYFYNNGSSINRVFIHGQSCLFRETSFECNYGIYLTKIQTKKLQVYDISMITPYSLLFFANKIDVNHNKQLIIIDEWIEFIAPSQIAVLINQLKKMCHYLLMKKITNPNINIQNHNVIKIIERLLKSDGLEH